MPRVIKVLATQDCFLCAQPLQMDCEYCTGLKIITCLLPESRHSCTHVNCVKCRSHEFFNCLDHEFLNQKISAKPRVYHLKKLAPRKNDPLCGMKLSENVLLYLINLYNLSIGYRLQG